MRILFLILLIFTFFVDLAKGADPLLAIKLNNNNTPVQYCTESVLVAKDLTIEGTFTITGMKISFSQGYMPGEDELVYSVSIGNIVGTWFAGQGYLLLKGNTSTTKENYQDAIKLVTYKNIKPIPTLGTRKISITLDDADYLDETKHFYQFISKPGVKWTVARDEAAATLYHGLLRGYLATILTKGESDFINLKTQGEGWIGASDEKVEEEWRWVTGPEGRMSNDDGLLFWKGSGIKAKLDNPSGVYGPVKDPQGIPYYFNWNNWDNLTGDNCTYEPNNWVSVNGVITCGASNVPGEDYAHITKNLKWNDYANDNTSTSGYLIEFGGMEDVVLDLTATLQLQVNTMLFKNDPIPAICEGTSVTLNQADLTATYLWTPSESLSDPSIANPVANPTISTTYSVTGNRDECHNTVSYIVQVNPKPVSLLKTAGYNSCKGSIIPIVAGDNPTYSYKWSNNATTNSINVDTSGDYSVTITTDKNCTAPPFTTKVTVHDLPEIDLSSIKSLICDEKVTTVNYIPANANEYSITSVDNRVSIINKLEVSVSDFDVYPMIYKAAIYPGCPVEKNFELAFFKTPAVDFTLNDQKCYGYNLEAEYLGDADIAKARFTWTFGGETIVDGIGRNKETIPLGVNQSKRDLVLKVEQNGCSNSHTLPDIRVIPTLSMSVTKPILCQPELFEFHAVNTETGVTYDWDFGDGKAGTGSNPTHQYMLSGKYDVQVTVTTNQNCTNTALIKEMVFAAPVPDVAFSIPSEVCLEPGVNEISYAGLIGTIRDKYLWDLGDFDASEILTDPLETQGPFKFDLKTKPTATLGLKVVSEFNCESKPIVPFVVKRKPVFSIKPGFTEGCIPFETELSGIVADNADRINFNWNFGDGTTGSASPVSHTYTAPGKSFNVILNGKSSVTGCENVVTATDLLKSYPKPTAKFSMDNKIVYNDKPDVRFTDLSLGASAWLWNFGEGSTSTLQNLTYHFMKMGRQKILLEVANADLCTDTVSQILLVAFDRLFPPNGFSPNASNEIDRVFLLNSDGIAPEGYHFTVLSRWNDVVFEAKDEIKGWDGRTESGSFAPAGAYVWILNFSDFLGRKHQQTGTVTLVY